MKSSGGGMMFLIVIVFILAFGVMLAGGPRSVRQQPDYTVVTPLPNESVPGAQESPHSFNSLDSVGDTVTPTPTLTPTP